MPVSVCWLYVCVFIPQSGYAKHQVLAIVHLLRHFHKQESVSIYPPFHLYTWLCVWLHTCSHICLLYTCPIDCALLFQNRWSLLPSYLAKGFVYGSQCLFMVLIYLNWRMHCLMLRLMQTDCGTLPYISQLYVKYGVTSHRVSYILLFILSLISEC